MWFISMKFVELLLISSITTNYLRWSSTDVLTKTAKFAQSTIHKNREAIVKSVSKAMKFMMDWIAFTQIDQTMSYIQNYTDLLL